MVLDFFGFTAVSKYFDSFTHLIIEVFIFMLHFENLTEIFQNCQSSGNWKFLLSVVIQNNFLEFPAERVFFFFSFLSNGVDPMLHADLIHANSQ